MKLALFLLPLTLGPTVSFAAGAPERSALLAPFSGFNAQGLAPVMALFRANAEGRLLLRKSRTKLGMASADELRDIFCFCEPGVLANPNQNGQFRQESTVLYRRKGETDWRSETPDGLSRLDDPARFPVAARKRETTRNFEYMKVAFMPKICVRPGLSVVETFLTLYHELAHLANLDPFDWPDLAELTKHNLEEAYYVPEMAKPGGELDAFAAQALAFYRLLREVDLEGAPILGKYAYLRDYFPNGRLTAKRKTEFIELLLHQAGYAATMDAQLSLHIMREYNRAHSWWRYFEEAGEQLDANATAIDANIDKLEAAIERADRAGAAEQRRELRDMLREQQNARRENRRLRFSFGEEQKRHIRLMELLDDRFPGQ